SPPSPLPRGERELYCASRHGLLLPLLPRREKAGMRVERTTRCLSGYAAPPQTRRPPLALSHEGRGNYNCARRHGLLLPLLPRGGAAWTEVGRTAGGRSGGAEAADEAAAARPLPRGERELQWCATAWRADAAP